jgi:myo-inositol-1(or 4)-monophosphatase
MTDLSKASRIAEQAVCAAGAHLQASRSRLAAAVVTHETPVDIVRAICDEVRALVRDVVRRSFPDHGFFSGAVDEATASASDPGLPVWVAQPLDGRANYLRGYPQYAATIALVQHGEPLLGAVYDPCRNEFFGAIRGRGAVLNGAAIRCAAPRPALEAIAATVFPRPAGRNMAPYITEFGRVLRGFGGVRRSGSTALELAYLAAGRLDAFWAHEISAWRAAAGIVLLRESGALIEARDGPSLTAGGSLVASTPGAREPLLSLLAHPRQPRSPEVA